MSFHPNLKTYQELDITWNISELNKFQNAFNLWLIFFNSSNLHVVGKIFCNQIFIVHLLKNNFWMLENEVVAVLC